MKSNSDNATTGEQHTGRQQSVSAELYVVGFPRTLFSIISRRQLKSFSVQQFFKNAAEVWASSPHLRSKSKLHHEIKQKSKRKSEESQLPSKSEGYNKSQGFRDNCDSQGKLGMCPSLAESDSGGIPKTSRRQRNPRAILLAHGASGEKSDSFSRWGEQDRSAL